MLLEIEYLMSKDKKHIFRIIYIYSLPGLRNFESP